MPMTRSRPTTKAVSRPLSLRKQQVTISASVFTLTTYTAKMKSIGGLLTDLAATDGVVVS